MSINLNLNLIEQQNHRHNRTFTQPQTIINGQAIHRCGKMRFGLRSLAAVGSGVVAVYNLMLLLNRQPVLADITRELYIRARTPFGILGVHPLRLFRYFSAHYIPVNLDRDFKSFCEKFASGYCGIVILKTRKGLFSVPHAMAIENDRGKIYVYNRFAAAGRRYEFSAAEYAAEAKNFIVGYYIYNE